MSKEKHITARQQRTAIGEGMEIDTIAIISKIRKKERHDRAKKLMFERNRKNMKLEWEG